MNSKQQATYKKWEKNNARTYPVRKVVYHHSPVIYLSKVFPNCQIGNCTLQNCICNY